MQVHVAAAIPFETQTAAQVIAHLVQLPKYSQQVLLADGATALERYVDIALYGKISSSLRDLACLLECICRPSSTMEISSHCCHSCQSLHESTRNLLVLVHL